jgi:hypothetical protein
VAIQSDQTMAEVTVTPDEAKVLIARAVVKLDVVTRAREHGLIVIHPSSSTVPVVEELASGLPPGLWALGMIRPKGLCISLERQEAAKTGNQLGGDPLLFRYSWVLRRGVLDRPQELGALLAEMGPGDVYVKGCNAIDPAGRAAVLWASPKAGTVGLVLAAQRRRGFTMVLPVGLEKLIPGSVDNAAREVRYGQIRYSLGQRCGLVPVSGETMHEARALETLFAVKCHVIAAGGIGGGEGSTVLLIKGQDHAVKAAYHYVRQIKGRRSPMVKETECAGCPIQRCLMPR